jgi:predicted dehydrogenase
MTRNKLARRDFLVTGAAAVAAPWVIPASVLGREGATPPSEMVRVGLAGLGGRARWILVNEDLPGAKLVAVADCELPRCDQMAAAVAKERPELHSESWKKYADIRQMLDQEKLDAVFVETTAHTRVWCMMQALAAGCDVYGEKPLTLTVAEGRILSDAARKLGRIVQTGTQQRSMPINAYASKLVRDGAIGKVQEVIVYNFEGPAVWQPQPEQPIPPGLNWDLWTNQVELRPYHPQLHRGWGRWEDYDGGGQSWGVTGWGTHSLDQVQCALGTDDTGPVEIWLEEKDAQGWPRVTLRYATGTLLKLEGQRHTMEDLGAIFRGEKGNMEILRGHARANPAELLKDAPPDTKGGPKESIPHIADFIQCVRTRMRPAADAETGHRATSVCHLINICRKLARRLKWDPQAEKFVGDDEASRLVARPRRQGYELPAV